MCPKSILAPAIGLNGGRAVASLYGARRPLGNSVIDERRLDIAYNQHVLRDYRHDELS